MYLIQARLGRDGGGTARGSGGAARVRRGRQRPTTASREDGGESSMMTRTARVVCTKDRPIRAGNVP